MILVEPTARLIGYPSIDMTVMSEYLNHVGGNAWLDRIKPLIPAEVSEAEALMEFAGKLCYRAWEPGLNPNVTKVRTDSAEYLSNIVSSLHGSVTEHAFYVFAFSDVSRVFTHELVRHRVGTSISQESMRYVRLDSMPMWMPDWAKEDSELMARAAEMVDNMEVFQNWMAEHFDLDNGKNFEYKKHMTSFMRRFAPEGIATTIVWGANVRTLRHVIELRTALGAEEEIRLVFDQVAKTMQEECPKLFADFERSDQGAWVPKHRKI